MTLFKEELRNDNYNNYIVRMVHNGWFLNKYGIFIDGHIVYESFSLKRITKICVAMNQAYNVGHTKAVYHLEKGFEKEWIQKKFLDSIYSCTAAKLFGVSKESYHYKNIEGSFEKFYKQLMESRYVNN